MSDVDVVYHFAAIVSVPICQQKPLESYQTNFLATLNVLEVLRSQQARRIEKKLPPQRLIFAGSSVVYGNLTQLGEKRSENVELAWPPSFYGSQKLSSEHAITLYHQSYGIPAVVFRFFNVYGVGQDPSSPYSGVISLFHKQLRENKQVSLRLNGGGNQTRDFISVHDVAQACARAIEIDESFCDGRAFNLGTAHAITIRELAQNMISVADSKGTAKFSTFDAPPREGDVLHSCADNSRLREVFHWQPRVQLHEGLEELFNGTPIRIE
jgi:UDP-glucose 4-epimerase